MTATTATTPTTNSYYDSYYNHSHYSTHPTHPRHIRVVTQYFYYLLHDSTKKGDQTTEANMYTFIGNFFSYFLSVFFRLRILPSFYFPRLICPHLLYFFLTSLLCVHAAHPRIALHCPALSGVVCCIKLYALGWARQF